MEIYKNHYLLVMTLRVPVLFFSLNYKKKQFIKVADISIFLQNTHFDFPSYFDSWLFIDLMNFKIKSKWHGSGNKICHFLKHFGPLCYRKCMYRNVVASCYVCTLFFEKIAELFFYTTVLSLLFFFIIVKFCQVCYWNL